MAHKVAVTMSNGVEKSLSDQREFRNVVLENGLQALLVSDPKSDKAGAALDVNVGHFSDPEEIPGLAHFLEHMLFLGTAKFPNENSYSAFLSENGGRSNAYTSMENTNYYFDVGYAQLEGALDRFSQFFIAPLFTPSATDRELNAVDSEHAKNLQDDMWRAFQLEKSTSNPRHPYHKFATGDSVTLRDEPAKNGVDVREALLKFHEDFYSANRMKLCVLGRESLDQLEAWVREYFSPIVNSNVPPPSYGADTGRPLTEAEEGRILEVVPVKDLRTIELTWALPSMQKAYQEGSERYISNLVGHEGPGSILSALKKRGLANELSAGLNFNNSDFSMFKVTVDCTESGIQEIEPIVELIFAYLNLLRKDNFEGVQKWLWEEVALQTANSFRFQSKPHPFSFVSKVASNMHRFPPEHILSGSLIRNFARENIIGLVSQLTPERCQIMVCNRALESRATLEERWYKTKYGVRKIPDDVLKRWNQASDSSLHLPHPNEFLPSDFTILPFQPPCCVELDDLTTGISSVSSLLLDAVESHQAVLSYQLPSGTHGKPLGPEDAKKRRREALNSFVERSALSPWLPDGDEPDQQDIDTYRPPVLVGAGEEVGGLLWLKQDTVFQLPKGVISCLIHSQYAYQDPRSAVLTELYILMVQDVFAEFAYDAEIAGLFYSFRNTTSGIDISLGGFTHKLANLLDHIMGAVCDPSAFQESAFERFKQKLKLDYFNFDMEQPYQHALYTCSVMLNIPRWHINEKRKEIDSITLSHVVEHVKTFLSKCSLETTVVGNFTSTEAINFAKVIKSRIGHVQASEIMNSSMVPRVVMLQDRSESYYMLPGRDAENINSAIEVVYQIGPDEPHRVGPLQVLAQIAQEPCFNQLRTEQQLGYIVFCGVRLDHGICSLRFIVQSSRADPYVLDEKIEDFLRSLYTLLEAMEEAALQQNVDAVLDMLLEKDKDVFSEARRWLVEIQPRFYRFSRAVEIAATVATLTKAEIIEFFEQFIHQRAPQRKKLVVGVFGSKHISALPSTGREPHLMNPTAEAVHALQHRDSPAVFQVASVKQFRTSNSLFPVQSQKQNKL